MKKVHQYSIDTGILDPQVKRSFKIRWRIFLVFVGFCGAAYYVAVGGHSGKSMLVAAILGLFAVLSLVTAIYRSHDRLVYYSRYGRVPLVVLFNRSPDQVTLDSFTAALSQQAEKAKSAYLGENHSLNEELKGLRQLMEEGVISRRRYDLAKKRILSRHY